MAAVTPEQKAAQERAAAKQLLDDARTATGRIGELSKSIDQTRTDIEQLKALDAKFKDVDVAAVLKQVEQARAGYAQIRDMLRLSKGGIYVPGLGENKEQFSIQRASVAIATKNWANAGYEERVLKETREAVQKGAGHIIGVDSQGGFFVPDQVIPDIIGAIYAQSVLISLDGSGTTRVSVLNGLTGIPATIPKFIGGMLAYWIGEQDRYVESAVKVGNVSLTPRKLGVLTRITDEMRRFSSYGFETLMRNDMVRAAAALIDYTVPYGTGTNNMPRGVFNQQDVQRYYAETHSSTAPGGASVGGELGYDDLMNMQGLVEDLNIPVNNSWAWIAHPRFFRRRRQDKVTFYNGQTTGQMYLTGTPMMTEQSLKDLIGDYGKATAWPSKNTSGQSFGLTPSNSNGYFGDVMGANWNDVLVGRWGGLEIAEDQGLGKGFATDETYIKMRLYMDIGYRHAQSIVACADAKLRDA